MHINLCGGSKIAVFTRGGDAENTAQRNLPVRMNILLYYNKQKI